MKRTAVLLSVLLSLLFSALHAQRTKCLRITKKALDIGVYDYGKVKKSPAAYGQGWDMDAIAACVVGGVSFTGGIGKISGVVTGVLIFTSLTYSLTILGIDTNLQFIFEGIIILAAVTLDCLKYVQKK